MFFSDQMAVESYVRQALTLAPGLETRNGAMLAEHNTFIAELATSLRTAGLSPIAVGGSDAHLLRYVGTTYTEAPGRTREEFLANLLEGHTQVGGAHGGRQRLLVEIYGSIANHWRGLVGLERNEISSVERLGSIVGSALLLPFQFIPGVIALRMKQSEQARIERYRRLWADDAQRAPLVTGSPPL
jgi:PHP-associated